MGALCSENIRGYTKSRLTINSVNKNTGLINGRNLRLRFEGNGVLVSEETRCWDASKSKSVKQLLINLNLIKVN